jgi:hypothetical protein
VNRLASEKLLSELTLPPMSGSTYCERRGNLHRVHTANPCSSRAAKLDLPMSCS